MHLIAIDPTTGKLELDGREIPVALSVIADVWPAAMRGRGLGPVEAKSLRRVIGAAFPVTRKGIRAEMRALPYGVTADWPPRSRTFR